MILDQDAPDVILDQDAPGTLFYLDPPYLGETRAAAEVYAHEMSVEKHSELLKLICRCEGKVMLSGYHRRYMIASYGAGRGTSLLCPIRQLAANRNDE